MPQNSGCTYFSYKLFKQKSFLYWSLLGLKKVYEAVEKAGLADEVGRGRVSDASSQKDDTF